MQYRYRRQLILCTDDFLSRFLSFFFFFFLSFLVFFLFLKVLELSPSEDLESVFHLVNLWLSNHRNKRVNDLIDQLVSGVHFASFKLVPLIYQIFSRIDVPSSAGGVAPSSSASASAAAVGGTGAGAVEEEEFQRVLRRTILKICSDHPHHALPQLFALAHEVRGGDTVLGFGTSLYSA